jgi:hypothetical protein
VVIYVDTMTAQQAADDAKGMTFEIFWAAMMEMKKSQQETDRMIKEAQKENDKIIKEAQKENEKRAAENDKRIAENDRIILETKKNMDESQKRIEKNLDNLSKNFGGLSNTLGHFAEAALSAELWEKFSDLGFPVTRQYSRMKIHDSNKRVLTEVDLIIENGDYVILVEIKTTMKTEFVDNHLERIEIVRRCFDERGDKRKLMGAVAAAIMPEDVLKYAQKRGFYVAVLAGEAVTLAELPLDFKAREW